MHGRKHTYIFKLIRCFLFATFFIFTKTVGRLRGRGTEKSITLLGTFPHRWPHLETGSGYCPFHFKHLLSENVKSCPDLCVIFNPWNLLKLSLLFWVFLMLMRWQILAKMSRILVYRKFLFEFKVALGSSLKLCSTGKLLVLQCLFCETMLVCHICGEIRSG